MSTSCGPGSPDKVTRQSQQSQTVTFRSQTVTFRSGRKTLEEEFPQTRPQRCWVHKTANVLDKLPKSVQPHAKGLLCEIYQAPTRELADQAFDRFLAEYEAKYPKAAHCMAKDRKVLLTFYDFPAEHWQSIRSSNPIESTFATVRRRTRQTKGCGSRMATLTMVYKLAAEA